MNYMFFESSRIIEKQDKYEKIRAYDLIESLEKTSAGQDYIYCALELMSKRSKSDFESAIILRAKNILKARKEKDEQTNSINSSNFNNSMPSCF